MKYEDNISLLQRDNNSYLSGIDFLKGVLVLFVILGHAIQGNFNQTISRYLIYSFHVPLFISISGFLIKKIKFDELSIIGIIKKYFFRMIFPWLIAIVFYYIILNYNNFKDVSIINIIKSFIYPYYHLWYIPALFSWIVLLWIFIKIKLKSIYILIISIILSSLYIIIYELGLLDGQYRLISFFNIYKIHYFYFFILGFFIKERNIKLGLASRYILIIILILVLFRIFYFYKIKEPFASVDFFLLNTLIIAITFTKLVYFDFRKYKIINTIGFLSLAFYLWHVAVIIFLQKMLIDEIPMPLWYMILFFLMIIFRKMILLLNNNNIISKYIFGNFLLSIQQ